MLTKKQKEVLDYVGLYVEKQGIAPSLEEIRIHFKFVSISTSHYYLSKLQKEGYLQREPRSRSVRLNKFNFAEPGLGNVMPVEFTSIPLVGSANCGPADLVAEQNIEAYIRVDRKSLPRKSGIFALRAIGNSLNNANIRGKNIEDGDIVLIDAEDLNVNNGDYVLSIIDGAANLKKIKIAENRMTLLSESTEQFKPIFVMPGDNWMINGKIIGVFKETKKKK